MEWSNDLILEFLELYQCEPSIWNPREPLHKDRNAVHDAWKRIETRLSVKFSIKELKRKKESLMASFRKLSSKEKASMRSDCGTNDVFKPDWFAYEIMAKFLHGIYTPNKTANSEGIPDEMSIENTVQNEEYIEPEDTESISTEKTQNPHSTFKTPTATVGNRKRKSLKVGEIENRMDEAYQFFKKISDKSDQDECSLYAELLAKKLRALDDNTRDYAMLEIDSMMYHLKEQKKQLSNPSANSHQRYSTSAAGSELFTYPPPSQYYPYNPIHNFRLQPSPGDIVYGPFSQFFPQLFSTAPPPHSQPPSGHPRKVPSPQSQPSPGYPPTTPSPHSQPSPGYPSTTPSPLSQPSPAQPTTAPSPKSQPSPGKSSQRSKESKTFRNSR